MTTKLSYHHEQAASILWKDIFERNYKEFEGIFSTECQDTLLPPPFKLFINMFLQGLSID